MRLELPELEPIQARHLPPRRAEILQLARELCLARCASVLRDLRLFEEHPRMVDPRAEGVAARVVELGVEAGLLRRVGEGRVVPTAKLAQAAPYGELLVERAATVQEDVVAFRWLTRALDALPSVLVGAVLAEEALFPRNDFSLVSDLYAKSAVFSFFSRVAVDVLAGTSGDGRALRVLEVGGGTGGTARALLERQPQLAYHFTDVSPLLVERTGRALTSAFEGRCAAQVLDVDATDWALEGRFDAMVALNVLHLAKDVDAVLRRLRAKLEPGGVLVLGEVSPPQGGASFPLMDLTFGLLPSFQAKGGSPLESQARWHSRLEEAGFSALRFLPLTTDGGPDAKHLGGVTLAFSPGAPS